MVRFGCLENSSSWRGGYEVPECLNESHRTIATQEEKEEAISLLGLRATIVEQVFGEHARMFLNMIFPDTQEKHN